MEQEHPDRYTLKYLERQLHNLTKLVDINGIINSTLDIGRLLTIIMEIIKEIMETEASTLLLFEEDSRELVFKVALGEAGKELQEKYRVKMGQGIAGWVAEHRREIYINDVYADPRFDPNFDKKTGFVTRAILCAPLLFKGKLLGVIQAINPLHRDRFDDDDTVLFRAFANQAALAVQNAIFFQGAIEEERIQGELASARSIQASLFPVSSGEWGSVALAARSLPAREVGGEFCDFFYFDDCVAVALGDVHAKGIPGALQAAVASGALMAFARQKGSEPRFIHNRLHELIREHIRSVRSLSLFYGVVASDGSEITFINSGAAYPILVRDGQARYLKFGGGAIGGGEPEFQRVKVKLKEGDAFVIVTDGLVTQKNRYTVELGLSRVMEFLSKEFDTPDEIADSLIAYADEFTGGVVRKEDVSIIALRVG